MKVLVSIFTLVQVLTAGSALAACRSTSSLEKGNWKIHSSSRFQELSSEVVEKFQANQQQYQRNMQTRLYSRNARRPILVSSFDNHLTPKDQMFGDVLFIEDLNTGDLIEIRWFADGRRQLVFNSEAQPCPANWIPWTANSLY